MDRRKFIGSSLVAGAAGASSLTVAAPVGRLFGTPDSVDGTAKSDIATRLTLSIGRLGVSSEVSVAMANTATLWSQVLASRQSRQAYLNNPRLFLSRAGIVNVDPEHDRDFRILAACCDEDARVACREGDYDTFFAILNRKGMPTNFKSTVGDHINEMFERDYDRFEAHFSQISKELSFDEGTLHHILSESDIQTLVGAFATSQQKACTLVLVCATAVALHAVAVVGAALGVAVVVVVVSAVEVEVFVEGQEKVSPQGRLARRLEAYGPEVEDTLRTIAHIEKITGKVGATTRFLRGVIEEEAEQVFGAAERAGFITVPPEVRDQVVRVAKASAVKAAGLG